MSCSFSANHWAALKRLLSLLLPSHRTFGAPSGQWFLGVMGKWNLFICGNDSNARMHSDRLEPGLSKAWLGKTTFARLVQWAILLGRLACYASASVCYSTGFWISDPAKYTDFLLDYKVYSFVPSLQFPASRICAWNSVLSERANLPKIAIRALFERKLQHKISIWWEMAFFALVTLCEN
jgi:hypothetical protein